MKKSKNGEVLIAITLAVFISTWVIATCLAIKQQNLNKNEEQYNLKLAQTYTNIQTNQLN
jgi:hypothetical protein